MGLVKPWKNWNYLIYIIPGTVSTVRLSNYNTKKLRQIRHLSINIRFLYVSTYYIYSIYLMFATTTTGASQRTDRSDTCNPYTRKSCRYSRAIATNTPSTLASIYLFLIGYFLRPQDLIEQMPYSRTLPLPFL